MTRTPTAEAVSPATDPRPGATESTSPAPRLTTLDVKALPQPAVLIFNPNAGAKMGLSTNSGDADEVQEALRAAGIAFEPRPTERPDHATELAREAVAQGRQLVIAAGGDGTVGEVAQALAGTDTVLGIMPLGSVMNVARTLCIDRDLAGAATTIAGGRVLAADLGRIDGTYFLEAAGIGLDAGLFGYFNRLDKGERRAGALRAMMRFTHGLGRPSLVIDVDGRKIHARAPMVAVANGPFVGAAYAIAPDARIDDGLLDVVVFRGQGVLGMLRHLVSIAGARRRPTPPRTELIRARAVEIATRGRRALPVHADGIPIGSTPIRMEVAPAALKVIVGEPEEGEYCAWQRAA